MMLSISSSQLYREAVDRLSQAGIANAKLEALWIVEEALGVSRVRILSYGEDVLDAENYQRAISLIERRAAQEPLQYVLGSQEFCGLDMVVNPEVLIPRPESELLVEEAIALLGAHPQPVILDVGTGSGCLGISIGLALKRARVIASDRSPSALQVARTNARKHGMDSRISWLAGDLLAPLLSSGLAGKVTAIIANLPYISHDEWDRLSPDVKDFEPCLALDGGPDGLDVYRRLLQEAPGVLAPEGVVLMEVGLGQADWLCREVSDSNRFEVTKVQPDSQGIPRMVCLQQVGHP
ncbi:MAG: peptide chain release factor N(5)-glutamine methyltransferase [Nitrospirales bacterium]